MSAWPCVPASTYVDVHSITAMTVEPWTEPSPAAAESINKLWYIQTVEACVAVQTVCVNPTSTVLNGRIQVQYNTV